MRVNGSVLEFYGYANSEQFPKQFLNAALNQPDLELVR